MVGAVGETASMKRRKLCCSSSAIQTRLDPLSLLEERSETPIVFVVLLCCRLPPNLGETAKVYRIIDRTLAVMHSVHERYPPDAEALPWLGGLGASSWALMLGGGVFLPDLGA